MASEQPAADAAPWFRRTRPDGRMEPTVGRDAAGDLFLLDNGWAASRQAGRWYAGLRFSHAEIAACTPVTDRAAVYRLVEEARTALADGVS
jgi:hypothetical protein